jgi:hypothetical protein
MPGWHRYPRQYMYASVKETTHQVEHQLVMAVVISVCAYHRAGVSKRGPCLLVAVEPRRQSAGIPSRLILCVAKLTRVIRPALGTT